MPEVVTRFAPSPTGHLHVGGARTALFCWALARRAGGRFLLRIEDTDQARSSEAASRGILADLAWLGLDWDEGPGFDAGDRTIGGDPRGVGPFFQAQRLDLYNEHLNRLIDSDLAYPAFDTPEELGAMRAEAEGKKETFRYRRAPDYDRDAMLAKMHAGEACVIRLRAPDGAIVVHDEVLGDVSFAAGELDDFVIRKADGFPTYHFAVVVDDELMGVTHVLRGQEHLMNTPRHVALQRALGFRTPTYAHLPLIFNPDGSKMSKRDKDKAAREACKRIALSGAELDEVLSASGLVRDRYESWLKDKKSQLPTDALRVLASRVRVELPEIDVEDFRVSGYLPEVLCNYLALLGWNPGMKNVDGTDLERFDNAFLAEQFATDRIGRSNSKFDRDKLLAFNAQTVQQMGAGEFATLWKAWLAEFEPAVLDSLGPRFALAAEAAQPRARTFRDALEPIAFVLSTSDAIVYDDKAVAKVLTKNDGEGLAAVRELAGVLAGVDPFEPDAIEAAINDWCESKGLGMGRAAQPMRVAITGSTVSPGLGQTLALVGKDEAIARIERCIKECAP